MINTHTGVAEQGMRGWSCPGSLASVWDGLPRDAFVGHSFMKERI